MYANNIQGLDYSRMDQTSNIQDIMTSSFQKVAFGHINAIALVQTRHFFTTSISS